MAKKLKISRTTLYRYLEKSPKEMVDWMESTKLFLASRKCSKWQLKMYHLPTPKLFTV
ncbi:hypothetical protein [uncultured Brevibacillus sp.]|uniref:hypothetical protein n=1 Tax=uncultured Brevibacillus sp. TaxID=169970 RepID=UPI00259AC611|nr:hypothetical protein [uncultured Brevibacillus sp.]